MLAITGGLKNNADMLKLISAYRKNNEMEENGSDSNSVFSSKETSPDLHHPDSGHLGSEMTADDTHPSDCDTFTETETTAENTKIAAIRDGSSESDIRVEKPTCYTTPKLNQHEKMPELHAQTDLCSPRTTSPLSVSDSNTPNKMSDYKKRAAAQYFASLHQNVYGEEKWHKCITVPKEMFDELVTALGISATVSLDKDYIMYECAEKDRYTCPYRARINCGPTFLICEHNGCHWHETDAEVPESSKTCYSQTNRGWFTCFDGPLSLKTPLTASLCVATKSNFQDGYELYDCLYQKKYKCDYKVRVKVIGDYFICEELGSHRHGAEKDLGSTTGLPSAFKDVVDVAFYQNWSYSVRQQKLAETAKKFGLVWDRKLTRQIDNRLSYLRRTTNIRRAVELGKQKSGSADDAKE